MKLFRTKLLVAGLLAGSLAFVGCKSNDSTERPDDTTEGTGTGTTGEQGTGTEPGTGGSGTKTKQSDDNLRMPYEDPLRTPEEESIQDAESEAEPGVHRDPNLDPGAGVGGSGLDTGMDSDVIDNEPNVGGNINDGLRAPNMPADVVTPDDPMLNDDEVPEDLR
jgi:hypothetical protein